MKTWKVVESGQGFEPNDRISLMCPRCGVDASVPFRAIEVNPVIAATGLSLIYDKPWDMPIDPVLPETLKCRYCRRIFTRAEEVQ